MEKPKKPAKRVQLTVDKKRVDVVLSFVDGDAVYLNGKKYAVQKTSYVSSTRVDVRLTEVL